MAAAILAVADVEGRPGMQMPVWSIITTSAIALVDLHRRKELALFHNLGVPTSYAVVAASTPAVVLEITFAIAL